LTLTTNFYQHARPKQHQCNQSALAFIGDYLQKFFVSQAHNLDFELEGLHMIVEQHGQNEMVSKMPSSATTPQDLAGIKKVFAERYNFESVREFSIAWTWEIAPLIDIPNALFISTRSAKIFLGKEVESYIQGGLKDLCNFQSSKAFVCCQEWLQRRVEGNLVTQTKSFGRSQIYTCTKAIFRPSKSKQPFFLAKYTECMADLVPKQARKREMFSRFMEARLELKKDFREIIGKISNEMRDSTRLRFEQICHYSVGKKYKFDLDAFFDEELTSFLQIFGFNYIQLDGSSKTLDDFLKRSAILDDNRDSILNSFSNQTKISPISIPIFLGQELFSIEFKCVKPYVYPGILIPYCLRFKSLILRIINLSKRNQNAFVPITTLELVGNAERVMQFLFSGDSKKLGKTAIKKIHWDVIQRRSSALFPKTYYNLDGEKLPSIKLDVWPTEMNISSLFTKKSNLRFGNKDLELAFIAQRNLREMLTIFWQTFCKHCVNLQPAYEEFDGNASVKRRETDIFYANLPSRLPNNFRKMVGKVAFSKWLVVFLSFFFGDESTCGKSAEEPFIYLHAVINHYWPTYKYRCELTEMVDIIRPIADTRQYDKFQWVPAISGNEVKLTSLIELLQVDDVPAAKLFSKHLNSKSRLNLHEDGIAQFQNLIISGLNKRNLYLSANADFARILAEFDIIENYRNRIIFVRSLLLASKMQDFLAVQSKTKFENMLYLSIVYFKAHEPEHNSALQVFCKKYKNYHFTIGLLSSSGLFASKTGSWRRDDIRIRNIDCKKLWYEIFSRWMDYEKGVIEPIEFFESITYKSDIGELWMNLVEVGEYLADVQDILESYGN